MATAVFIPVGFMQDTRIRALVRPSLLYIFLMSFLGHKEWRFVVYVVPLLNIAAAHGIQTLCVSSFLDHIETTFYLRG
jgi:alpha-1,6-mannosyltransferase